jgi:hypothetical protein
MGIFTVVTRRATFKELSTRLAAGLLLAISIDTALRRGRDDGPRQTCHDDLRAVGPGDGVMVACLNRSSPNQDLPKEFLEHSVLTEEGLSAMNHGKPIGIPALISFYNRRGCASDLTRRADS